MGVFTLSPLTLSPVNGQTITELSANQVYVGVNTISYTGSTPPSNWIFELFNVNPSTGIRTFIANFTGANINGPSNGAAFLVTTLVPSTTYNFLLTVQNTSGISDFGDSNLLTATTFPPLNYGGVLTASGVTKNSVTITPSSFNAGGNPWSPTVPLDFTGFTYQWFRSTVAGTLGSPLAGQTNFGITDTTVSASTTYYYTAQISDGRVTANSTQLSVSTLSATLVLGSPVVSSVSSSQVTVQAGTVTGGVPPYTYQWQRSITSGSGYTDLVGQTGTTLVDNTVAPNTTYYYVYVVTDSGSDTLTSTQVSATTFPTISIAMPTVLSTTASTASLTDVGASGGTGTYFYQWYRSTIAGFSPNASTALAGQISLSITDSGLQPNTNYFYKIVVIDSVGNSAASTALSINTLPGPLAIGALVEVNVSTVSAEVTAPSPTGGTPPYFFTWFRSDTPGSLGVEIPFTSQTITDFGQDLVPPGLQPNTSYYYTAIVDDSAVPTPAEVATVQLQVTTSIPDALGAYYASLLIYQYQNQPSAVGTIQAFAGGLTLPAASTQTADNLLPLVVQNAFNLSSATGAQLDTIGKYQGVTRSITTTTGSTINLDDVDFRTLITLAIANKAATQTFGGVTVPSQSLAGIDDFLVNNFPGLINVSDPGKMELTYFISTQIGSSNLIFALINDNLLPKPLGVGIGLVIVNTSLTFFGFSTITGPTSFALNNLTSPFNTYEDGFVVGPWLDYQNAN